MPFSGSGAIWDMASGTYIATNVPGAQADYDTAKGLITAGIFYVGPGLEALTLGTFGANVSLMRVTNTGIYAISRFHIADGVDPTKLLSWNASAITTGTTRTANIPNWSGNLILPVDNGLSGQFLRSNGAGVQPSWQSLALTHTLLESSTHTDTQTATPVRGDLIAANSTPLWARFPIGVANTLLKSNGTDPSWGTVNLLSAFHADTAAASVVRGDIIVGNSTPAWARLAIGAADTFLGSDGTDATWRTSAAIAVLVAPLIEHNQLFHLKPFSVSGNVSINNGSAVLTDATGTNRFANVRVGDRINLDDAHYDPSLFGFRATTSGASDPNNITMDRSNTSGLGITGATATVHPGDHWDNTIAGGLLSSGGWGTFDRGSNPGGTVPVVYGSIDFQGYTAGATPRWTFLGAASTSNPDGFAIKKRGASSRVFHYAQNITADRWVQYPNSDGTFLYEAATQNVSGKSFQANNIIQCQNAISAGSGTVFSDDADSTKQLLFDCSGITAGEANGKMAKWQDLSAGGHVDYTYVSRTTAIDAKTTGTTNLYTVPAGKSLIVTRVVVRCTAATAITVGPSYGIGIAAGEDDIVASAAHTTFIATDTFVLQIPKDPAVVATAAQVIKIGIDTAATGTSMTLAVDLQGYLV